MSQQLNYGMDGSRPYSQYYRHSNRVGPLGVILGGLGGLAVGAIAAVVYAYLIVYIPVIYFCILLTVVFGAALGRFPAKIMRWGNVRSLPISLAIVAVITLLSYAFHWIVWTYALINRADGGIAFGELLANPRGVLNVIGGVYEQGTWGMSKGDPMNGWTLGIVWLGEAVIIFSMAFLVASKTQTAVPFCEKCNKWCPAGLRLRSIKITDHLELKRRMEMGDWTVFDEVGIADAGAQNYISIIHHHCPTCATLNTLSANSIQTSVDSRGRATTKVKGIVKMLLVSQQDVDAAQLHGFRRNEVGPANAQEVSW